MSPASELPLIVSLHLPKTAGNSLLAVLDEHFGDAILHDYLDYPMNTEPRERHRRAVEGCLAAAGSPQAYRDLRCIHGHFLPLKYLLLADSRPTVFVAWLRDPVERLVSHYHYWYDHYDPGSPDTRPLHRRVVEEQWSLERFCLSDEMRNLYGEFLWGFPLERFDFIGITENYEADLRAFSLEFLGSEFPARVVNERRSPGAGSAELGDSLRERVERWHAADIDLYRRAVAVAGRRGEPVTRVSEQGV